VGSQEGGQGLPPHCSAAPDLPRWVAYPPFCNCRKVGKAYFALLDVLCHNHANVIATRDTGAHMTGIELSNWRTGMVLPCWERCRVLRLTRRMPSRGRAHSLLLHRRRQPAPVQARRPLSPAPLYVARARCLVQPRLRSC